MRRSPSRPSASRPRTHCSRTPRPSVADDFATAVLEPPTGLLLSSTCTGPALTTPTYVDATSTAGYGTPLTLATPPGAVEGDLPLAQAAGDDTTAISAPGWTLIREDFETTDGFFSALLYRFATSSEPATHTFTPTQIAPGELVLGVNAYRGVDPTDPIDAHGGQPTSPWITDITTPSITTTVPNTRLVGSFAIDWDQAITPPGVMTERWEEIWSTTHDAAGLSADEARPAVGPTGARVAVAAGASSNIGQAVALAPDPAATVTITSAWTGSPSPFASGHRLERWRGGTLEDSTTISPASVTSTTDTAVAANTTYEYRLVAVYESWTPTVITDTVTTTCAPPSGTVLWRRAGESTPLAASWVDNSIASQTVTSAVGEWRIMQAAGSTDRDELIAVGVDVNDKITAETRIGGAWAAVAPNPRATASESFWWGFDVAYESTSGDALLVWNNGSTGTEPISSMVFDGSTWTTPATVTAPLAGEAQQMQLAASPTSDEMILVISNDSSQDYALVWDGTDWVDTDAQILDPTGTGDDRTDVNVAYEQQTGEAMVVYGRNGSYLRHRTWDGTWSNETSLLPPTGVTGDVRWTTVATDPNSDRLAFAVTTRDDEIWLTSWTGTFWQNGPKVTNQAASQIAPVTAVAFESLSSAILVTYGEDTAVPADDRFVHYRLWTPASGTMTAELDGPDLGDRPNSMMLDPRAGSDEIMLGVQDDASDLNYVRWDGTGFGASVQLDGDTGEVKNQPFAWLWH